MTDEKWRSPTRHSIASDVTDKLPPKGEARDDVQGDLLSRIEKMLYVVPDKDGCFKSLHDLGMWISRGEAVLIKRALAQQQTDAAWLLVALDRVEAVMCHEVCSSTNKKISDSGELCRSDISKIRSFLLRPVDLKELKKKEYHNLKVKAFLEQEEDDGQTKRAEQKGQNHE